MDRAVHGNRVDQSVLPRRKPCVGHRGHGSTGRAWRADGTIVYATSEGLYEIPANGGGRKLVARPDRARKEELYAFPQFLPGGHSIVFTVVSQVPTQTPQTVMLDL